MPTNSRHAVYADPDNTAARKLLAKNFEQLGYLAETGYWRNAHLSRIHPGRVFRLIDKAAGTFPLVTRQQP